MSVRTEYVVRSGYGFVKDVETGLMVANASDPSAAAAEAMRFASLELAEPVAQRMRDRGLEVDIVSLEVVGLA